jgi:hypothetical protein
MQARGVDVLTAHDDGASDWEDDDLLQRATELGRVFFSQDRELLAIAREWQQIGREFAGVIYAHQLGITIGTAISDLELIATGCDPDDMKNGIEFLPL